MQLFEGNRDLEVVPQHVESCEDVRPLHHLPKRPPLQDLGTEDVAGLLRQKADVNEDLNMERKRAKEVLLFFFPASSISENLQVRPRTAEILRQQFHPDCQNSCANGPR